MSSQSVWFDIALFICRKSDAMNIEPIMIFAHVSATWFMVGLIWFVQIVHYPLMRYVGSGEFVKYEQLHSSLTTWVVGPAMLIEVATLAWLLCFHPPVVSRSWLGASALLLAIIWISTQAIQVRCHAELCQRWESAIHARLVTSNWIRTIAWSLRGSLVVLYIFKRGTAAF